MLIPGKTIYSGPGLVEFMYTLRELREMAESGKYEKCKTCKGKRRFIADAGFGVHEVDCMACMDEDYEPTGLIL
jgi:hypothetical protein